MSRITYFILRLLAVFTSTLAIGLTLLVFYPYPSLDQVINEWPNNNQDVRLPELAHFKFVNLIHSEHNVTLNVLEGGEQNDPLIILLHGFPETALMTWGHLIDGFIKKGYHVIAPDMRGYNTSSKPLQESAYDVVYLATDVKQLISDYAKKEKATVIGVDWGGAVAWVFTQEYPQFLERLVVSVPMLGGLKPETFRQYPKQLLKSWYVFFFQLRGIAERAISRNNFAMILSLTGFDELGRKGLLSRKMVERYISAMRNPKELTSTLNYYRALFTRIIKTAWNPSLKKPLRQVEVPTMILFPGRDKFLEKGLAEETFKQVLSEEAKKKSMFVQLDSSHWLTIEHPDEVFGAIMNFLL